jgi:alkaline phosphatase D
MVAVGAGAAACAPKRATAIKGEVRFSHGVAAGDPGPDRLVIWTRVSLEQGEVAPVRWIVAQDKKLRRVIATGEVETSAARDFTVKVDVDGLKPGAAYYYGFFAGRAASPIGRARTLPVGKLDQARFAVVSCSNVPFGFFNAYADIAKRDDLDAVLHLGDYIYEYGADGYGGDVGAKIGRPHDPPHEIVTLADYRRRHAQYKSDPDLQAAHAACAWIVTWDDHETTNDSWRQGAQNHQPDKEGLWDDRRRAALQAYYEWMPIRDPVAGRPLEAIQRSFAFGDLVKLLMLETRLVARAEPLDYAADLPLMQTTWDLSDPKRPRALAPGETAPDPAKAQTLPTPFDLTTGAPSPILDFARVSKLDPNALPPGIAFLPDVKAFMAKLNDPNREFLGAPQQAWIKAEVEAAVKAGMPWQLFGNQVIVAQVNAPDLSATPESVIKAIEPLFPQVRKFLQLTKLGLPLNLDAWDGYPAERARVFKTLIQAGANPIFVTGDTHTAWANNLIAADGAKVGVEFGTTSVTSPGLGNMLDGTGMTIEGALQAKNPNIAWTDQSSRGWLLLTLKPDEARAEFQRVSTILSRDFKVEREAAFRVRPGRRVVEQG